MQKVKIIQKAVIFPYTLDPGRAGADHNPLHNPKKGRAYESH